MKAEELRLGNYVLDSGGKVLRIDFFEHLQSDYDCKFGQRMFVGSEEVHPMTDYTNLANTIPLTEQWLIDFGFERRNDSNFWLNGFCLKTYDNEFYVLTEQKRVFIEFVHSLQNLYFALTGEELQL